MENLLLPRATAEAGLRNRGKTGIAFALAGVAGFTLHLPRALRRDRPGPAALIVAEKAIGAADTIDQQCNCLLRSGWTVLSCRTGSLDASTLRHLVDEGLGFLEQSQFIDASQIELWLPDHAASKATPPRQSALFAADRRAGKPS